MVLVRYKRREFLRSLEWRPINDQNSVWPVSPNEGKNGRAVHLIDIREIDFYDSCKPFL